MLTAQVGRSCRPAAETTAARAATTIAEYFILIDMMVVLPGEQEFVEAGKKIMDKRMSCWPKKRVKKETGGVERRRLSLKERYEGGWGGPLYPIHL